MAFASSQQNIVKKTAGSSADFSVLSVAESAGSLLANTSWPHQENANYADSEAPGVPSQADDFYDNGQISASHYALATAYERVSKKLAEAEKRNKQLLQDSKRSQLRTSTMSGSPRQQASYTIPPDLEDSVNEAWEAYNEKCNECQQLREELEEVKQRANNSEHFSRIQSLQEVVMREKAKQDVVFRKLEKTKMEADSLEKKEIMAREELEKEREYQKNLIQIAEKRHNEMEQRISELERNLSDEKSLTQELRRREKDYKKALDDEYRAKRDVYQTKMRELEDQNISLKEEVAVLVSMQTSNTSFNGLTSRPLTNGSSGKFESGVSIESDKEIASLEHDVQSLHTEISELRVRANEQTHLLSSLLQNPKMSTLLESIKSASAIAKPENCVNSQLSSACPDDGSQPPNPCFLEVINSSNITTIATNHIDERQHSQPLLPQDLHASNTNGPIPKINPSKPIESVGPSLKTTEEFIRGLSQGKNRKRMIPLPQCHEVLDISRVIHTPESGNQNVSSSGNGSHREDLLPLINPNITYCSGPATLTCVMSKYMNGEIEPKTIVYSPNSLPMDTTSYTASSSFSSTDTLVQSPGPVLRPSVAADAASIRQVSAAQEVKTPANRYMKGSSDEDNNSDDGFEQISNDDFCPKEFVVPKVVRASDVSNQKSWKAFQDTSSNATSSQTEARPAIRAKPNVVSAHPHQYPESRPFKKNQPDRSCPMCNQVFSPDWTADKMSRHINAHFSDDDQDNDLSFD